MKKSLKSALGVTLLEVMLVLAIAAIIIVMSVRYYQAASVSNQVNSVIQEVTAIAAAADSLAQNTGSYTAATQANVQAIVTAAGLRAPWGTTITIGAAATTVTMRSEE